MSELASMTKRSRELEAEINAEGGLSKASAILCTARIQELEADLLPRIAKLLTKSSQVDPITQQARYGPQTVSKIQTVAAEMQALVEPYRLRHAAAQAQEALELKAEQERMQVAAEAAAAVAAEAAAALAAAAAEAEEQRAASGAGLLCEQALQQEAEFIRQSRAAAKVELQAVVARLNGVRAAAANTIESLGTAFCQLSRPSQIFLHKLISNIVAHPNDEKLRRIRINHPAIVENVSQFQAGIDALLIVGFEAFLEAAADECRPLVAAVDPAGPYQLFHLSAAARSTVVLNMSEPSLEDGDTTQWLRWHDDLTAYQTVTNSA